MATLQGTTIGGDVTVTARRGIGGSVGGTAQGFQGYYAWWQNNIAYTVDFNVRNVGAGQVFWCSAAYDHSGGISYGAGSEQWYTRYSGGHSALYELHNHQTGQGGSIGWTSPNITQIRVTKNAGYYPGQGGAVVQIRGPI